MTALAFADRKNQTSDRYEIDGFPIRWNADTYALVISSRFPTVLSQVYDYLRSISGDSLVQCSRSTAATDATACTFSSLRRPTASSWTN